MELFKSNNGRSLGIGLLGSSEPILLPPLAASTLVFKTTVIIRLLVYKATTELDRRCELSKSNGIKLTRFNTFSGIYTLWIVASL